MARNRRRFDIPNPWVPARPGSSHDSGGGVSAAGSLRPNRNQCFHGYVYKADNLSKIAALDRIIIERTHDYEIGKWKVFIKTNLYGLIFNVGEHIVYNSKGTWNPNADNHLVITKVPQDFFYFIATGTFKINT